MSLFTTERFTDKSNKTFINTFVDWIYCDNG